MSVITVAVNILLLMAMIATKQALINPSSIIIMFMSCADLLNGMLSFPLLAAVRLWCAKNCFTKTLSEFITIFLGYLSSMAIVLLAIDRYLHIQTTVPLRESFARKLFKGRRLAIPMMAITVFSMTMSILFWLFHIARYEGKISIGSLVITLKITSISTITIFYIKAYNKVRRFVRTNSIYNSEFQSVETNSANKQNSPSEPSIKEPVYLRNLQKTVTVLVIALMATYIPQFVAQSVRFILLLAGQQYNELLIVTEILNAMLFCNSAVNSIIIFKMNKRARSWLFKKLKISTNAISTSA